VSPRYPDVSTMVHNGGHEQLLEAAADGLAAVRAAPRNVQRPLPSVAAGVVAPDLPTYPGWSRDGALCSSSPSSAFILLGCDSGLGGCGAGLAVPVCCGRADCPACAGQLARHRASRLAESWGGRADLGVLVVTLPDSWASVLTRAACRGLEDACWAALTGSWAAPGPLRIGGRVYWHPCGDECRACGAAGHDLALYGVCRACGTEAHPRPHLNYLVPLCGVNGAGDVVRLRPFVDVAELRARVGAALAAAADRYGLPTGEPVQLHWSWRREDEKKRHSLRYFSRPFPGWSVAMASVLQGSRVRRLGLDPDTRSAAAAAWRAWMRAERLPSSAPVCPCCGGGGALRPMGIYSSTAPILHHDGMGGLTLEHRDDDGKIRYYLINRDLSTDL
jgi:hypothetical protein